MYGTQTRIIFIDHDHMFENDVEMYGTQTLRKLRLFRLLFENDVEMYGTQTNRHLNPHLHRLRMM